jgi:hypothetical protein
MRSKLNKGTFIGSSAPVTPHVIALSITLFVALFALFGVTACSSGSNDDSSQPDQNVQTPGQTAGNAQGWQTIDMIANQAETKLDTLGHFDTSRNACGQEAYGTVDLALWNQMVQLTNSALSSPATPEDKMNCFDAPNGNRMDGTVDLILSAPENSPHLFSEFTLATRPTTTPTNTPTPHPTPTPTPTHPTVPTPTPTPTPTHTSSPSPSPSPSASVIAPKRRLFENDGGQICSTIQNAQTAQQLLQTLSQLAINADKQNCANGYGH